VPLASQSPRAVVPRRGPANAICSSLWDHSTDRFEVAQWLRGRIYERRADLSPGGLGEPRLLLDANRLKFEARKAPY
jgi:hypothetical protein